MAATRVHLDRVRRMLHVGVYVARSDVVVGDIFGAQVCLVIAPAFVTNDDWGMESQGKTWLDLR